MQGIRAVLDQIAQGQNDSSAASLSKPHSTPKPLTESDHGFSIPAGYSPSGQDRGTQDTSGTNDRSALSLPHLNAESLLHWPKIIEIIGRPVVERSFLLECTSTPSSAPEPQSSQYGIHEDDYLPLCRRFLDQVHVRSPILEPRDLEQYAKEVTENGLKWDNKSCLVVCYLRFAAFY